MVITNINQIIDEISAPFIILAGSVVSFDLAPTVDEARRLVFENIYNKIKENGSDIPALSIAHKALKAIKNENFKYSLLSYTDMQKSIKTLKFEEFIRKMSLFSPKEDFIFNFVRAAYQLNPNEFNQNHQAIAHLLFKGHCHCVMTTNFDNAIENACAAIGFFPEVLTIKDLPPNDISHLRGKIIKLHGCAIKNDIIADSAALASEKLLLDLAFIKMLTAHYKILTFGYSGTGDVDIFPHLKAGKQANIYWSNYCPSQPPFGEKLILSNLKKYDENDNMLYNLGLHYGCTYNKAEVTQNYETKMQTFFNECDFDFCREILLELVGTHYNIPHAYYWFGHNRKNLINERKYYLKDPRMLAIPLNNECRLEIEQYAKFNPLYGLFWNAFIKWRHNQNEEALKNLKHFFKLVDSSKLEEREFIVRASEITLGVMAESLWLLKSQKNRTSFMEAHAFIYGNINTYIEQSWWGEIERIDQKINRLRRTLEIKFNLTQDKITAKSELNTLFEQANSLELFPILVGLFPTAWMLGWFYGNKTFRNYYSKISSLPMFRILPVLTRNLFAFTYNFPVLGRVFYRLREKTLPLFYEKFNSIKFRNWEYLVEKELMNFKTE